MNERLRDLDLNHVFHPYTDIRAYEEAPFTCVTRAEGVYLYIDDRPVLDGISSWWAAVLGHGHPKLVKAIREQAGVLQHAILGNMVHPKAIELAHRLAQIIPEGLEHVYFAADGASATEAALKIALQYWWNMGVTTRNEFVCLKEGYHGDTLGAVGVGFVPKFHAPFENFVKRALTVPAPYYAGPNDEARDLEAALNAFAALESLIQTREREIAGIILEPLCQGAAGMRIYHPEYLRRVRKLCDESALLLIADEIAVGFGRTGSMFACETAGITPDILCLGKAMTGGYLPMSAAIVTDRIYDSFRGSSDRDCTFYDGHTFCGNPITSAAALAALEVIESEELIAQGRALAPRLVRGLEHTARFEAIAYHKTLGMIGMCVVKEEAGGAAHARRIAARALELGLFIRPLGDVLYLWPPLVCTEGELQQMIVTFTAAVDDTPVEDPR